MAAGAVREGRDSTRDGYSQSEADGKAAADVKGMLHLTVEKEASGELTSYGTSPEEQINNVLARHSIVVFGKTWCPFCVEALRTLGGLGVHPAVFNLDKMANGATIQGALKTHTQGHATVPFIFINGSFIGGCDDMKDKQASGELTTLLRGMGTGDKGVTGGVSGAVAGVPVAGDAGVLKGAPVPQSLFWFPQVLDNRVVRTAGFFTFITSLLIAVFFERPATRWVMGGLMVDFVLRLFGGGSVSPLGSLAQLVAAVMELFGSKPHWVAGPPKQFATFCVMFTSLVLFFLLAGHAHACIYVGLALTCILAVCAGLEGAGNVCVGCICFQWAVRFGLVSPTVYMLYANSRAEQDYTYTWVNQVVGEPLPGGTKRPFEEGKPTAVDLSYKPKTDDMTKEDVNVIKNTKITQSVVPLSLAGLALAFMLAAQKPYYRSTTEVAATVKDALVEPAVFGSNGNGSSSSGAMNGTVPGRAVLEVPGWDAHRSPFTSMQPPRLTQPLGRIKVFSGTSNQLLSGEVASYLGVDLGRVKIKRFADGEVYVQVGESIRGCDVFLIQPTCPPVNDHLMELLVMIDACRRASARSITAVLPYYGYARADRKTQGRESIAAKLTANLITEAGADRVLAMDLHSGQCVGYFDIPVDHVYGETVILDYLASKRIATGDLVVVSPDVGGVARARAFAKKLNDAPLAIVDKRRSAHNVSEVMNLIGDVKGKVAVLVDDMIDTAGTITNAAKVLRAEGARQVFACATHAVFSPPAIERLSSGVFEEVIVTNTIPVAPDAVFPELTILSVANLLGETIWRVFNASSVQALRD